MAREIADLVAAHPTATLGLATGSTMTGVYAHLVLLRDQEGVDFRRVQTFNLDEYMGLPTEDPRLFRSFMQERLFTPLGLQPKQVHFPDVASGERPDVSCRAFEDAVFDAGGIDYQLLGIGRNGHIAFNEPGAQAASRTRLVHLDALTRQDAAAAFGGLAKVPETALTMGVATILEARQISVLAFGEHKRAIVGRALQGPVGPEVPATFLRSHPNVVFHLDETAAGAL